MDLKTILKHTQYILRYYGASSQVPKAVEEMCELITELSKNYGHSTNRSHLQEEVADVLIMALQMAQLFGWDEVRGQVEYKLSRQMKRINLHNNLQGFKDPYDALIATEMEDNIAYGE